jgi:inositol hexakisphosphate/diphosphoinositol-pentakisphosphate kinase
MAARIVNGFEQRICKFDVLRTSANSYVIDINGFSYAKENEMYYDNCARILRSMFFAQSELDLPPFTASPPKAVGSWKLKGVVAVIRHGDLTPKQSFEFYSASESLMAAVKDDGEVSLEDDEVLASVLQAVTETIAPRYGEFEDALRRIMRPRLDMQVRLIDGHPSLELLQKAVLPEQRVTQTNNPPPLFELSWGGLPLHSLRYQSRDLGTSMRDEYLLLNKALLDDVTVFSGGEKASITSAQIWTTSFLNVQELPEDVIAVRKDLLSDLNAAKDDLEQVRRQLDQSLDPRIEQARLCLEECERAMKRNFETLQGPPGVSTIQARWCSGEDSELFRLRWGLLFNQFPMNFDNLYKISDSYTKMKHDALHNRQFLEWALNPRGAGTGRRDDMIIGGEEAARKPRPPSPHPSRVSYFKLGSGPTRSLAANRRPSPLQKAYTAVKTLTEYLKPCLYGVTNDEKLRIGLLITLPLLREIVQDLEEVQASGKAKSFIYFTEQSHMYGLFNSIVQGGLRTKAIAIPDFDDLSQICFELWESPDTGTGEDESHKYSAQISVSPGCYTDDPLAVALDSKHVIGSAARMPMTNHVDWKEFMSTLSAKFRKVQLPKALMTSRERDR